METLQLVRVWLMGKKTYLGLMTIGLLGILWSCGILDDKTLEGLLAVVALLTGVSYRATQGRIESKIDGLNKL
jgi:hypothetical protein